MNIGLYQSAASLSALERWQEAISQNLASSQVAGFRQRTVDISARPAPTAGGPGVAATQGVAGAFPRAGTRINFAAGETSTTGRELDAALLDQGEGFFEVRLSDGRSGFTRGGEFHLRADRTLVTSQGYEVLAEGGAPLQFTPDGGPISFGRDGSVSQGATVLGRLSVQKFADPQRLQPLAGGLFAAAAGQAPEPVAQPVVAQGVVEVSNVNTLREMVSMINVARAYEVTQKLIATRDQNVDAALRLLG